MIAGYSAALIADGAVAEDNVDRRIFIEFRLDEFKGVRVKAVIRIQPPKYVARRTTPSLDNRIGLPGVRAMAPIGEEIAIFIRKRSHAIVAGCVEKADPNVSALIGQTREAVWKQFVIGADRH